MRSPASISVRSQFHSSTLHSREQAQQLYTSIMMFIRNTDEIYIDFSEIQFVSRSFADELIYLTSASNRRNQIIFCCMNNSVDQMIQAVGNTQNGKSKHSDLPVHKFPNTESLLHYFSE